MSIQYYSKKDRDKLKKKKWSKSKIDRYLEDKIKNQKRNEENRELGNKTEEEKSLKIIQKMMKIKKHQILYPR